MAINVNAPWVKDAKTLAEIFLKDGKEAYLLEINKIIKKKKIEKWAAVVLNERVMKILQNNGVILKKRKEKNSMRTLITGKKVKELKTPVKWSFESKCPAKWIHIDCQDGHVYAVKENASWLEPTLSQINAAIVCLKLAKKNLTTK